MDQITEDFANELLDKISMNGYSIEKETTIYYWKEAGYIKSDPVENLYKYMEQIIRFKHKDPNCFESLIYKANAAIEYLKEQNETNGK
jgi:organic radical activating enzyme